MRPKCQFKHNGKPTTLPGTDDDRKRIALSHWITAMLVFNGDEQPGEYQTPGANGYTDAEIASAKVRLAHLNKAVIPEAHLQAQALDLLRLGFNNVELCEQMELAISRFQKWRENEEFEAEWQAAKLIGESQREPRRNTPAYRPPAPQIPTEPVLTTVMALSNTDQALQAFVLDKLANGVSSADAIKGTPRLNGAKLAAWRKDPAFKKKWDDAKAAGNKIRDRTYTAKEPKKEVLPRRTIHQQAFADDHPQEDPAAEPTPSLQSAVNGPAHYGGRKVFDQMLLLFGKEAVIGFCRLNIYKYNMRAGKKPGNSQEQDLSKADWYEQRLAELLNEPNH